MVKLIDETGNKYNKLIVLRRAANDPLRGEAMWEVQCDCGSPSFEVRGSSLRSGNTTSCGCHQKHIKTIHGKSSLAEYDIWCSMRARCAQLKRGCGHKNYGGRGIRVCDRWLESFENFLEDMGERPSDKHSIDRIDVNGDYCPENCRWATPMEQANNKRNSIYHKYRGESKTLRQWSEEFDIPYLLLKSRIYMSKWDIEKALTTPQQSLHGGKYR